MNQQVEPASHLAGTLSLPSDKSISHRSVLFAALHEGTSEIYNFSDAEDPQSTLGCLRQLGVSIEEKDDRLIIEGVGRDGFQIPDSPLDCGNSGTTMRLLSGIVGGAGISCELTGDASLSARTMRRIIEPLQEMGIHIKARDDDFAPLHIERQGEIKSLEFPLPIASAQLKSCVLLAGLFGEEETRVIETLPSRDHTERLLQLPMEGVEDRKIISSSQACIIPPQTYSIPGDFSAAAFWLVAASIHPEASIKLRSVGINPSRIGALHILQQMGAELSIENERAEGKEPVGDLLVQSASLKPINITREQIPNCLDELPVLIIAMLFADGVSTISGAGELRHKETDRLKAMAHLLESSGARYEEKEDGFKIYGNPAFRPHPGLYKSEHDHRIAMAAAVLAMMGQAPSSVSGSECTAISYPAFWQHLSHLTK